MKKLLISFTAIFPTIGLAGAPQSLCTPTEKVVFSCPIHTGKHISVCSSEKSVQYRFGRPGKVELEYPKPRDFTPASFEYFHYFRPGETRVSLQFETQAADYTVFSESEGAITVAGVAVEVKSTGRTASLQCASKPKENWYEIEGKVVCANESMNTCE
jgi:hypothetical protein